MQATNSLSRLSPTFKLDLSQSTLIEVLDAFVAYKRKLNTEYKSTSIRSILVKAEEAFNCTLMPSEITDIFYSTFIQWMHDSGHKYTTIKSYCDQLRGILLWGARHGCRLQNTFDLYQVPQCSSPKIALTQDEISHIAHFELYSYPGRPQTIRTLISVRDTFMLCCNLGQRYSDIVRIGPDNFNRNIFKTVQKKTGNKAVVDIDKYAIIPGYTYRILERYGYHSPYQSSASNFDMYLHKLLRIIGDEFNEKVTVEMKINGAMVKESRPKWELCTSHTGRRSFITLNVMRSPTEAEVRRCSGHSTAKSFERYIYFGED